MLGGREGVRERQRLFNGALPCSFVNKPKVDSSCISMTDGPTQSWMLSFGIRRVRR